MVQPIVAGAGVPGGRQAWIIGRLRAVGRLSRADVETEFGIGARQAKRLLSELTGQGRVRFVRRPHPGHYVLAGEAWRSRAVDVARGGGIPNICAKVCARFRKCL